MLNNSSNIPHSSTRRTPRLRGELLTLSGSLRWIGLLGIVVIAVMRCVIVFTPQVVFDVDPAFDPTRLAGLGPAGSMMLDVLLLLSIACGLAGETLAGRHLNWMLLVLAFLPMPVIYLHGWSDAGDLWRGSTWAAAVPAGVTLMHLARDRRMWIITLALLTAVLAPLLFRGATYVFHEHPQLVDIFEQSGDAFFRARGIEPGSTAAADFERRLRQPQPTGWFATTNIFASVMTFGVVLGVGLAIGTFRHKLTSGWPGVMILLSAACIFALWLSGSKGAWLSMFAGLLLVIPPLINEYVRTVVSRWVGLILIGFVLLALLGVVVRGALLPEDFLGEKSLLFRWHYLTAAGHIFIEHPLLGVGADSFQSAYTLVRSPRNPEEVISAHSVFIDWITMLGLAGLAWTILTLRRLAHAGKLSLEQTEEHGDVLPKRPNITTAVISLAAVGIGLIPAIQLEGATLHIISLFSRIIGIILYFIIAGLLIQLATTVSRTIIAWTLTAAITAVLIHSQIEMTLFQPGSVVWVTAALGAAAGGGILWKVPHGIHQPTRRITAAIFISLSLIAAGWITAVGVRPAWQQETLMLEAAKQLRPIAVLSNVLRNPDADRRQLAARQITEAMRTLGVDDATLLGLGLTGEGSDPSVSMDPSTAEEIMSLVIEQSPAARIAAADLLKQAYAAMPTDITPLNAAAEQLAKAGKSATGELRLALLTRAVNVADEAVELRGQSSSILLASRLREQLAKLTGDSVQLQRAIDDARILTERDPNGLSVWRRLGDLLWEASRPAKAAAAYERTLEIDDNYVLDPLKQLPDSHRQLIEGRIRMAGGL